MVKKIILILLLLPLLLWVLAPKKELFYLLEKRLATQGIVLSDGQMHEKSFGLTITHPSLYFKGIKIATINEISFWSVGVYTQVMIDTLTVDPALQSHFPKQIEKGSVVHSVLAPKQIKVSIVDAELGGEGSIDLQERSLRMVFSNIPSKSPIAHYLKKTDGGWIYERQF